MTNIFLVDDSETDMAIFEQALSNAGYTVHCVPNTSDIVTLAVEHQPDFVILDLFMPGRDGFSICRALKSDSRTHEIPVIFFSSSTDYKDVLDSMYFGVVDFITKPVPVEDFIGKIRLHELVYSVKKEWNRAVSHTRSFHEKYGTTDEKDSDK